MCGIAAIISQNKNSIKIKNSTITNLVNLLKSRGPDGTGIWHEHNFEITMINTRLATQDKRTIANQPNWSMDKSIVSILNGEIYNHNKLRKILIKLGYQFDTLNDNEVLANGYQEWGDDLLKKIEGQFSLVIYNVVNKSGIIARDPFGICPLYYTVLEGNLIVSSTFQSILSLPNISKKISKQSVYDFYVSQTPNFDNVFIDKIHSFRPGDYFKFEINNEFIKNRFYKKKQSDFNILKNITKDEVTKKIQSLITNSIDLCIQGDKEVGIYLSGGIDSISLLAYLSKNYPNKKIKTFTAGFIDIETKEAIGENEYATSVAKIYGSDHENIYIDQETAVNSLIFSDLPQEGVIDIAIKKLAEKAKSKNVDVCLSGEGADEIFLAYDHYLASIGMLNEDFKWLQNDFKIRDTYKINKLRKKQDITDYFIGGGASISLDQNKNNINKSIENINSVKNQIKQLIYEIDNEEIKTNISQQLAYIDYSKKVPNNLMRRAERQSMGVGVEMRFPYLSSRLINYLYKVPLSLKIGNAQETKSLLRDSLSGILPIDILKRPKSPFGLPMARTKHYENSKLSFKKPAFNNIFNVNYMMVHSSITQGKLAKINFFKESYIRKLLEPQKNKSTCFYDPILWRIWSMSEWYQKNI